MATLSTSDRERSNEVSKFTTWNSILPMGVVRVVVPIGALNPTPNYTVTFPAFDLFSLLPLSSRNHQEVKY